MGDIDLGSLLFWGLVAWVVGLRPSGPRLSLRDFLPNRTPRTHP